MKRKLFILLFFFPLCLAAQNEKDAETYMSDAADLMENYSPEQLATLKKLSVNMCDCIEKKKLDLETITEKKYLTAFTGCLLGGGMKDYTKLLKTKYGKKVASDKVGAALGLQMFTDSCDNYVKFSMKIAAGEFEQEEEAFDKKPIEVEGSFVGIISEINTNGDYLCITIISDGDKEKKLYVAEDFSGSKDLMMNSKKLLDKKVFVKFKTRSLFMKSFNYFTDVKMISSLEIVKE